MLSIREYVLSVAERFASASGNRYETPEVAPASPMFDLYMGDVAQWYMTEKAPSTSHYLIQSTYVDFRDVIDAQYHALSERIEYTFTDFDPIDSAEQIGYHLDIGHLPVWDSVHTGGHPVWSNETNNRFRAVHDTLGHYLNRVGFDKYGEDAAYRAHRQTMPARVLPLLATETRGQNAALNYGDPIGTFKVQKAMFAPNWIIGF